MPTVSYPGVYIQELPSAVHAITGVATSIGAFVGYTASGIDNRAQQIFSFSDYERLYGGLASDSEVSYAVQQFFANGGNQAWVVRTPRAGAAYAGVQVAGVVSGVEVNDLLNFVALSSGAWANGGLILDVDYNGLSQPVAGSVAVSSTTVAGTATFFASALQVGQWLIFASDTTQTPYQIASIASDTSLTLNTAYTGTAFTSSLATVIEDPTAFNLTINDLVDNTVETFPTLSLNINNNNYILNVVNDPDNGSQLVNVSFVAASATTAPPVSGVVGSVVTVYGINNALGGTSGTTVPGSVGVTQYSPTVTGTGFASAMIGQWWVFASDLTGTPYQVSAVNSATSLTLSLPFLGTTGSTTATAADTTSKPSTGWGLSLSVASPSAPPSPLPITISLFPSSPTGSPLPQTMAGWAGQLQRSINAALMVQMPGASVQCSVFGVGNNNQAIRINASLPQIPDAVISFPTLSSPGLTDASTALGLGTVVENVAHYALGTNNGSSTNGWDGQQYSSSQGSDGSGLPGTAQLIGDPGSFSGIYALQKVDIFNLLCIPDATRALSVNSTTLDTSVDPNAIYSAAIALCDSMRAFLLLDCPPYVTTIAGAMDWKTSGLTVNDPNGAAFFPRLRLPDPLNNYNLRTFAPCGVVAGVYSQTDSTRGVWKAPAGIEATLGGVQSLVYKMSDAENGVLNPLGLNCFRTFPVYGSVLWGARTLVGADAETNQWKYVPIRRVALFLESSLYQGTQWVVFEPNDEPLWSAIRLNVGSFMQNLFIQGYFQGSTPSQAYFVKCDSETTTQTDIDNGIVNIVVGFAPLYPAEFVVIQIEQLAGQTAS